MDNPHAYIALWRSSLLDDVGECSSIREKLEYVPMQSEMCLELKKACEGCKKVIKEVNDLSSQCTDDKALGTKLMSILEDRGISTVKTLKRMKKQALILLKDLQV